MKRIIILFFLCCTIPLIAQHTDPIQEAMANYDYETALSLIAQKKTTPPLLLQKGKVQIPIKQQNFRARITSSHTLLSTTE